MDGSSNLIIILNVQHNRKKYKIEDTKLLQTYNHGEGAELVRKEILAMQPGNLKIHIDFIKSELKTLEWWISGLRLDPLFFLISRLNIACLPHDFNLQINYPTGYLDISF